MNTLPTHITLCTLELVVMPNGELICNGKTVGWFQELKEYLQEVTQVRKERNEQ
jgi:hypothetical protein